MLGHPEKDGLPGLHTFTTSGMSAGLSATGASLKELMARLGPSSTRAAMIYQHATRDRDVAIAQALGGLIDHVRSERANQASEGV
jgi:hypothetical protein